MCAVAGAPSHGRSVPTFVPRGTFAMCLCVMAVAHLPHTHQATDTALRALPTPTLSGAAAMQRAATQHTTLATGHA